MTTEKRAALYLRVSTDEQAKEGTIENQRTWLSNFAQLYRLNVVGTYEDDGWTGTVALKDRPGGRRLLEDAEGGRFDEVVVYRIDRLARSLSALLDAHNALEAAGVTIRSAMEPFDTATPIGKFMFQLLGGMAELDRSTILERTVQGRDRRARAGKWTGGVCPIGYDVDADGYLVPSGRLIEPLGITEAELVVQVFQRIAEGSTALAEVRRLNLLGVPSGRRFASGQLIDTPSGQWNGTRLSRLIRNSVYCGTHAVKARSGPIEREVPALVSRALWEAAGRQLTRNRKLSKRNSKHSYLLRGLVVCGACGYAYAGQSAQTNGGRDEILYYRCNSVSARPQPSSRCQGKMIRADELEAAVWDGCRTFILNPGDALAEAQAQLRERLERSTTGEAERRALLQRMNGYEQERERVMVLFRRGRITLQEADDQLDAINREAAEARMLLDALSAQAELLTAWESRVTEAAVMLGRLRERLEDVERTDDRATKRQIVELLVRRITIHTEGTGRRKTARANVVYAFAEPSTASVPVMRTG